MNSTPSDPAQHHHEWIVEGTLCAPTTFMCTQCTVTTTGCVECDRPLLTDLAICERCLIRARKIITDIVEAIDTVPFHHAEIMGLRAVRYDRVLVTSSGDSNRLPFGLDMVYDEADPTRQTNLGITVARDPQTAVDTLQAWAEAWADTRGDPYPSWQTYLPSHTLWAAQNVAESQWATYLDEARQVRSTVRRLLGINPEREAVPCALCGGSVRREWTSQGLDDLRQCSGCGTTWPDEERMKTANQRAILALPATHPDVLVTLAEAKAAYRGRIRPNLLGLWVHRDARDQETYAAAVARAVEDGNDPAMVEHPMPRLAVRGRDSRGAALYRLGDVDARTTAMALAVSA